MRKHLLSFAVGLLVAGVTVAVLVSLGAFAPNGGAQFTTSAAETAGTRPAVFPGLTASFTGSGTFRVPSEAPPGEYAITSTSGTFGCSWWVLKADDGKPKSEISAGTFNRAGFDTLTIPPTARWLKLLGDCTIRAAS